MKNKFLISLVLTFSLLFSLVLVSSAQYDDITSFSVGGDGVGSGYGLAVDDTYLYIADYVDNSIYLYYLSNYSYTGTTYSLSGEMSHPYSVGYGDNKLYVLEQSTDNIFIYHSNGTYTGNSFSISGCVTDGAGVTSDGTYVWVSDITGHKLCKYYVNGTEISSSSLEAGNSASYGMGYYNGKVYVWDYNIYIFTYYADNLSHYATSPQLNLSINSGIGFTANQDYFFVFNDGSDRIFVLENQPSPPVVNFTIVLNTPENNTHIHGLVEFYNFTANISSSNGVENATYYLYNETSDLIFSQFQDLNGSTDVSFIEEINISAYDDGDYTWKVEATESLTNTTYESDTFAFELHLEPPHLTWISPSENIFTEDLIYNLNVTAYDPYLDAVNVSVYNSSNNVVYNNFSDYINTTSFDVFDMIPLDYGLNVIEVCARDSLTESPKIRDLLTLDKNTPNIFDETFDLILDNGVIIRRTTYIVNNGGQKVQRQNYNLVIEDNWIDDGKHIKTDIISDKLLNQNWGIRVDFECIEGCEFMEYLDDRGRERIVDSGRNLIFQYDDAKEEGWDVQFSQQGDKASVIISYPDLTFFNSQPSRHTIDPITAGANSICESYNITRQVAPTISIVLPVQDSTYAEISTLTYTYTGDCESVWVDDGTTITMGICGENFTGLTAYLGENTWTIYINNSVGSESSDSVTFEKINFEGEIITRAEDRTLYNSVRASSVGLYFILYYLGRSIPYLIIPLVLVGIVVVIGFALGRLIKNSVEGKK